VQRITPNLWFDDQAEEAARFYTAVFKNSRINTIAHYGSAGPLPAGTVMMVNLSWTASSSRPSTAVQQISSSTKPCR
jgi:predicted 3-demethylubiquinone-9 3-methyltransferase (glyoxalase superfamily)